MQWISRFFQPIAGNSSATEKIVSGSSAFVALLLTGYISIAVMGSLSGPAYPLFIASIGAVSVLVFATPHSPVAQPWPVIGGQILSAIIGMSVLLSGFFPDLVIAASVALCFAIIVMYFLRCLHPPGGATALAIVLGGPQVQELGYMFVVFPVAVNSILLVIMGVLLTRFIPNRHYPAMITRKASLTDTAQDWALGAPKFKDEDLREALDNMDSYVTVSEYDLSRIYALAMLNANKRRLGNVSCKDIMIQSPITFQFDDELEVAWDVLQKNNIKGAPVVDKYHHLIGMITTTDYMRHATGHDEGDSMQERFRRFIKRSPGFTSSKAEVVGQIMSTNISKAFEDTHIIDLIPVFTEKRFHHMPIVDKNNKVVGVVARSAVMRSMLIARM